MSRLVASDVLEALKTLRCAGALRTRTEKHDG